MQKVYKIFMVCFLVVLILSGCSSSLYMRDRAMQDNKNVVSTREPNQHKQEEKEPTIDEIVPGLKEQWAETEKHLASLKKAENLDGVRFYYSDSKLEKVVVAEGTYGEEDLGYKREYYYDDLGLYFAKVTKGNKNMRFYFKDGWLIRWLNEQGEAIDKPNDNEDFETYDYALFQEANGLLQVFITEKSGKPESYSPDGVFVLE